MSRRFAQLVAAALTLGATLLHVTPTVGEEAERWELQPADCWAFEVAADEQPAQLVITKVGEARNKPVRRPYTTAVLKAEAMPEAFGTITLQVRSLEPDKKKGKDAVIILGYVDDTHYTYVHVSNDADGRAHNVIMQINGNTRRTIQQPARPEPRLVGQDWHDVKITIDDEGQIHVFMGDMETPLMTAIDAGVVGGRVGVGSFNDRAAFTGLTFK